MAVKNLNVGILYFVQPVAAAAARSKGHKTFYWRPPSWAGLSKLFDWRGHSGETEELEQQQHIGEVFRLGWALCV